MAFIFWVKNEVIAEFGMEECKTWYILIIQLWLLHREKTKEKTNKQIKHWKQGDQSGNYQYNSGKIYDGLDQGGGSGEGNKWSDPVYPIGFAEETDVGRIRKWIK